MPVGSYPGPQTSIGNGATTVFPYNFRILQSADLRVALDGVTQSSGYTVSGVGDVSGGNVTFTTAPATDVVVLRERAATYDRSDDYQRNGDFAEENVDKDFDRAVMLIQQLKALSDRAPRVPAGSGLAGDDFAFPNPGAGYYIRWNAAGTALEAVSAVNDAGSVTVGTQTRSVTAMFADPVNVLNYIPVALHADIRNGTSTTPVHTYIQAAIDANPGRVIYFPSGRYYCTASIVLGGDGSTELIYNGLRGEGWPNYQGVAMPSLLYFAASSGVVFNNAYCGLEGFFIQGTKAGGSNPVTGTFGRVGLSLSGTEYDGGSSCIRDITIYGFDVGVKTENSPNDGFAGAYFEIGPVFVLNCDTGWALTEATTDFRVTGGKTTDCTNFGLYGGTGSYRNIQFVNHLFELCGELAPNLNRVAVRVDDITHFHLIGGYLEAVNMMAGKGASISLHGVATGSNTRFWGEGDFYFGDSSLGRAIPVAVNEDMTAWTASNCAVAAVDTATHPKCYRITSTANGATQVSLAAPVMPLGGSGDISPRLLIDDGIRPVLHFMHAIFQIKWDTTFFEPTAAAQWVPENGFGPVFLARGYDASGDSFAITTGCDPASFDFSDNAWHQVNLVFPIRWTAAGAYLGSALKQIEFTILFSDGVTGPAYNGATSLQVNMRPPKITFYQSVF